MSTTPIATSASAQIDELIWPEHQKLLKERAIALPVAVKVGIRSVHLDQVRRLEKTYGTDCHFPGLPTHPVTGLLIPYQVCSDGVRRCRVRVDETEYVKAGPEEGSHMGEETIQIGRYVAQAGVPVAPYIPFSGNKALYADVSRPIFITEAPFKALSLMSQRVIGQPMLAIGLGGVLAGATDRDVLRELDEITAHPELKRIKWTGRTVYIAFDAGVANGPDSEGNPLVALGAARVAYALRKLGADCRLVIIPYHHRTEGPAWRPSDQGPDDYIYRSGLEAFLERVQDSRAADPKARVEELLSECTTKEERIAALHLGLEELTVQAGVHCLSEVELNTLAAVTKPLGVGIRALRSMQKEFAERMSKRTVEQSKHAAVYELKDGAFFFGEHRLSNFRAEIVEDIMQDDGVTRSRVYRIGGHLADGTKLGVADVPADEFPKMAWLDPHWGSGPSIAAGRGVADHVRAAIKEVSKPVERTIHTVTGWRELEGKRVFLMPSGAVPQSSGVKVEVSPPGMGAYEFPPLGTQEEQQEAVRHSLSILELAPDSVSVPLLACTYLAPLATVVGVDFTVFLVGRTGTFKSTLSGLAQAHFGETFDYNNLPANWFSTATFLEAQLHRAKDVLTVVDNYVPPQSDAELSALKRTALRILQTVGDRQSRGRCNADASEKPLKRPQTMLLATGEILPPSNESTLGRIAVVHVGKGDVSLPGIKLVRKNVGMLSQAMRGYVEHLAAIDPEELRRLVAFNRQMLAPRLEGAHERVTTTLSMLLAGFLTFLEYAEDIGAASADEALDLRNRAVAALTELGQGQPRNELATASDEYLESVRTLLISGRVKLSPVAAGLTKDEGEIGWDLGNDVIYLEPALTFAAVAELQRASGWRYSTIEVHQQLRRALHDDGEPVLAAVGEGRNVAAKRSVGALRPRVLVVRRSVLEDALGGGAGHLRLVDDDDDLDEITQALSEI